MNPCILHAQKVCDFGAQKRMGCKSHLTNGDNSYFKGLDFHTDTLRRQPSILQIDVVLFYDVHIMICPLMSTPYLQSLCPHFHFCACSTNPCSLFSLPGRRESDKLFKQIDAERHHVWITLGDACLPVTGGHGRQISTKGCLTWLVVCRIDI